MSSANLMIVLEACVAAQSWVNRKYRRGLSTQPCVAPVLKINVVEVLFPTFTTWGAARQEFQDPVAQGRVQTQVPELNVELEGTMVLKAEL